MFVDIITNMPTSPLMLPTNGSRMRRKPGSSTPGFTSSRRLSSSGRRSSLQDRYRYDGADVAHMILKRSDDIDWNQLISSMELYWEVLLMAVLNFRFVYPSERDIIPRWVMDELLGRLRRTA